MKEKVFEALNNAFHNGYDMTRWIKSEILDDIARYCPELENEDPKTLEPFIEEWLKFKAHVHATFEEWLISREELQQYADGDDETKSFFKDMYEEYLAEENENQ